MTNHHQHQSIQRFTTLPFIDPCQVLLISSATFCSRMYPNSAPNISLNTVPDASKNSWPRPIRHLLAFSLATSAETSYLVVKTSTMYRLTSSGDDALAGRVQLWSGCDGFSVAMIVSKSCLDLKWLANAATKSDSSKCPSEMRESSDLISRSTPAGESDFKYSISGKKSEVSCPDRSNMVEREFVKPSPLSLCIREILETSAGLLPILKFVPSPPDSASLFSGSAGRKNGAFWGDLEGSFGLLYS